MIKLGVLSHASSLTIKKALVEGNGILRGQTYKHNHHLVGFKSLEKS